MIRRDLLTGHWKPYLERAISLKPCYEGGINGGEVTFSLPKFYDGQQLLESYVMIVLIHGRNNYK